MGPLAGDRRSGRGGRDRRRARRAIRHRPHAGGVAAARQARPRATLPLLDRGDQVSLEELRGHVVVVNFWASWCAPCRAEHPELVAAAAAYQAAGVRFVGVVYQDTPQAARGFLQELGRGQGYLYVTDPDSQAAIDFGVFGIPETFFLDRRGTVVAKITGRSTFPLLADTLDQILAGQTPQSRRTGRVQPAPRR